MELRISVQLFMAMIFVLVLASNHIDIREKNRVNTLIDAMFLFGFLKIICNMLTIILEGNARLYILNTIFTAGDFGFGIPMFLLFLQYYMEISNNPNIISKKAVKICYLYGSLLVFLDIFSIFVPIIYSCKDGIYRIGPLFSFYHLMFIAAFIMNLVNLYTHRNDFTKRQFFALISYVIMPLVGSVLRIFLNKEVDVVNMGITLGIIIIYITIHIERGEIIAKKEKEMTEARMAIMLSQMQPHFLYNSLSTIRVLCHRDSLKAEQAMVDLSEFLRGNMDSLTNEHPISFEQELSHTKNYLALEKIRFSNRLKINYSIEATLFRLPTLTLQPLVENAVRYGVMKKVEGGTVTIATRETEEAFFLTVTDDGVGFDVTKQQEDGRSHIGISNVRSRLKTMCNGTLQVESTPGVGTKATITIRKYMGK